MKANQIYVNFPVKDIQKTKEFWTKLGFPINEQFSDDKAVCVMMNEDSIYVMFLVEEYFQTFIDRPIAPVNTTRSLVSIGLNSREEVDQVVNTALENGAYQHEEPEDFGWMYQNSFWDPDGHGWNIIFADPSQMPAQ
ncbi:glyoxalase/bleomycin resistance/extradiol dioxygenase family protein [Chryseobacterium phosphatilyticum]|uniref:Glyoxalase/bleomycin resistance/extradiol dioxygenase family protein n=1 Tax=Chryseobacterium phosphatilyticum TaxID=475075 RepID=A0A316XFN1_9FLAO|nr:VOC family protein [Chryseobacterium phosphatilyticum]PWN71999.1 glyoxalase/bleomycin resistance/extradiol dioxygenase family protein [Chryseobacterium phosphatilyticum]